MIDSDEQEENDKKIRDFIMNYRPPSDIQKFIDLYHSVGIELEAVLWDTHTGKQYLKIELEKDVTTGNVETRIWFNGSGKFIQQGIWE